MFASVFLPILMLHSYYLPPSLRLMLPSFLLFPLPFSLSVPALRGSLFRLHPPFPPLAAPFSLPSTQHVPTSFPSSRSPRRVLAVFHIHAFFFFFTFTLLFSVPSRGETLLRRVRIACRLLLVPASPCAASSAATGRATTSAAPPPPPAVLASLLA